MPRLENRVTIEGKISRGGELAYTASNKAYCNFGFEHLVQFRKQDGTVSQSKILLWMTVWGDMAEELCKGDMLKEGRHVIIDGALKNQKNKDETWSLGVHPYSVRVVLAMAEEKSGAGSSSSPPSASDNSAGRVPSTGSGAWAPPDDNLPF